MPVTGMRLATTAMFSQAWAPIHMVIPVARSAPKASGARRAMRSPVNTTNPNSTMTESAPTRPSSSASTAKIESV